MLNTGIIETQPVNVVYSGYHLWYKLKQNATTASYLCARGIPAAADAISTEAPLDFKCLHVDDNNSAFADLHVPMLNEDYEISGRSRRVSTCLGIDTLRLPTQAEIDAIPEDDAAALFGDSTVIVQESESISEESLVFVVADIAVDDVKIFEDVETYRQCMTEDLACLGKHRLCMNSMFAYWIVPVTLQVEVDAEIAWLNEHSLQRAIVALVHSEDANKHWKNVCSKTLNSFPVTEPMNLMQGAKKISDGVYEVKELFIIEETSNTFSKMAAEDIAIIDAQLTAWKQNEQILDYAMGEPELVRGSLDTSQGTNTEPKNADLVND